MVSKNKLSLAIRFIISFGLLSALIWMMRSDIGKIFNILRNSNKLFFAIAMTIHVCLAIVLSFRLKLVMSTQKIFMPMKDFIYLTFIGFFFNNFLPTAIGGDVAKAYYAGKKTRNNVASYAAVLLDRLFGLIAIIVIAIIGFVFIGKDLLNEKIIYALSFVLAGVTFLVIMLFFKKSNVPENASIEEKGIIGKLKSKILKLYSAINIYRNRPMFLIKIVLLSAVMQAFTILGIYFYILCIGGNIPLLKLFLIIPIIWAISMLPSLNGLGVREGAFVYFLKSDIGTDRAFAISMLWLGLIIFYSIIGGVLHLLYPVKIKQGGDSGDK